MRKNTTQTKGVIRTATRSIPYTIEFVERKTTSISVNYDLTVTVTAPPEIALQPLEEWIKSKSHWIEKQIDFFIESPPPRYDFVDGEKHLYLGKWFPLKIQNARSPSVQLQGRQFNIFSNDEGRDRISMLLDRWYLKQAKELFNERLGPCLERLEKHSLPVPRLKVRKMRTRWGSCSPRNNISLNAELIKTPVACIDYVIVHELCHLKIRNHGPYFYAMLEEAMPDWKERKTLLNDLGASAIFHV